METLYKFATSGDAQIVKKLINEMYGIEYEVRDIEKIAEAIDNKTEIYLLAYRDNKIIGFSGASLNNDYYADIISRDVAVVDYIYIDKKSGDVGISFQLIRLLLKELVQMGVQKAIMQVQTYNKQRFFHYALSDKNIIQTSTIESNGKTFEDQILLIEDLKRVSNLSLKDLMLKAYKYKQEEN